MPANLRLVKPSKSAQKPKVRPTGRKSDEAYGRSAMKYLTEKQVEALIAAAKKNRRNGNRDALMISLAFHHGMRASELTGLLWSDLNLEARTITVRRRKKGRTSPQLLVPGDLRVLRAMHRERKPSPHANVFLSERKDEMSVDAFQYIVKQAGKHAGVANAHCHALRHAAGHYYALKRLPTRDVANLLGHKDLSNAAIYTEGVSTLIPGLWD
jgi:integrase